MAGRIAVAALLVNIIGANVEWFRLRGEAATERQAMLQVFRAAYPNQPVTGDPVAQMRRNISVARAASGEGGGDEFTAVSAALAEALAMLPNREIVAGLEYKERALIVKLKPNSVDANGMSQVQAALAPRKLALLETGPGVWQVKAGGAK